jgi:hypothetical protein
MPIAKMSEIEDAQSNDNWMGFRETLRFEPKYIVYRMEASDDDIEDWLEKHYGLGNTLAYLSEYRLIVFATHEEAIECLLRLG